MKRIKEILAGWLASNRPQQQPQPPAKQWQPFSFTNIATHPHQHRYCYIRSASIKQSEACIAWWDGEGWQEYGYTVHLPWEIIDRLEWSYLELPPNDNTPPNDTQDGR